MSSTKSTADENQRAYDAFELRRNGHTWQQVASLLSTGEQQYSADQVAELVQGWLKRTREDQRLKAQEAARIAFNLRTRPTPKEMGPLAEGWRPWRAVAARLLWSYYRAIKQREGVLIQDKPAAPGRKKAAMKKKRGKNGR